MKYQVYDELTINGTFLKGRAIEEYCRKSKEENIRNIGKFISEWLSDSSTIEVQTSGSTGKPKIIEFEKQQLLQSASATAKFFKFRENQTALLCLPMSYIAGKMMVVRALFSKLRLICIEPDSSPLASIPSGMDIDFAALTPMQLKGVVGTGLVKTILLGGAPVSRDLEKSMQKLQADIYHGFGMAETLSHIALRKVNGINRSDIYQVLPGVKLRTDENGCLILYVPFLKEPIVTHDVVDLIDEQSFIWKGRGDHIINTGGIKLFPEDIERKLVALIPQRFFVAGLPDETYGQKLCLIIEGEPYLPESLISLKKRMERCLSKYENPRAIYFLKKFQTTESGKIRRKQNINMLPGE